MDYKELVERLKCPQIRECPIKGKQTSCGKCQKDINKQAANAITDLLSRAEAAEALCATLEKMVKKYQDIIVPGYRERAEKAERERDAAVSDIETILAYGDVNLDTCQYCKNGQCYARGGTKPCFPKWRGEKEE